MSKNLVEICNKTNNGVHLCWNISSVPFYNKKSFSLFPHKHTHTHIISTLKIVIILLIYSTLFSLSTTLYPSHCLMKFLNINEYNSPKKKKRWQSIQQQTTQTSENTTFIYP